MKEVFTVGEVRSLFTVYNVACKTHSAVGTQSVRYIFTRAACVLPLQGRTTSTSTQHSFSLSPSQLAHIACQLCPTVSQAQSRELPTSPAPAAQRRSWQVAKRFSEFATLRDELVRAWCAGGSFILSPGARVPRCCHFLL